MRTQDFRDTNKNGVDDRDEKYGRQGNSMRQGSYRTGEVMNSIYGAEAGDDESLRQMKYAFGFNQLNQLMGAQIAMGMGDYQAGIAKDMISHTANTQQMMRSNDRYETFNYNMLGMDKSFDLRNRYADNQLGRDLITMQGYGEQQRLGQKEAGNQFRLNTIAQTEGAMKQLAGAGHQNRLNLGAAGFQNRALVDKQGVNNRLQSLVDNEQWRLNNAASSHQTRETMTHQAQINAAKEKRSADRSRSLGRAA